MKIDTKTIPELKLTHTEPITQALYRAVMGEWSIPLDEVSPVLEDPVINLSYIEAITFCLRLNEIYELAPTYLVFDDGTIMMNNPKGVRLLDKDTLLAIRTDEDKYSEWAFNGYVVGSGPLCLRVGMFD